MRHDVGVSIAETTNWIDLQGAVNARAVVPGVLLRSDNLQGLTATDVRRLIDDHGLRVVIDTRTDREAASEGPGPMTRVPEVQIEHRSLSRLGGSTDLDIEDAAQHWGSNSATTSRRGGADHRAYQLHAPHPTRSSVPRAICDRRRGARPLRGGQDHTGMIVAMTLAAAGVEQSGSSMTLASAQRIQAIAARLVSSRPTAPSSRARHLARPTPRNHGQVFEIIDRQHGSAAQGCSPTV